MTVRVAFVSTSRSDYSALYWVLREALGHRLMEPLLVVGGSHLSREHGMTVSEIEADGWQPAARLPFLDGGIEQTAAAGARALSLFADWLASARPDVVFVLGDRWELLPIATATLLSGIPLAHAGGGDLTLGAIDEQVRHAVTKMAHVHFPGTPGAARRIRQMGEERWRVHVTGDPAVDQFARGEAATADELASDLGFVPDRRTLLVTFHPPTLEAADSPRQARELAAALEAYEGPVVVTAPAPDPGTTVVREILRGTLARRRPTVWVESLGGRRYRGLLRLIGALVGNSSSALIEAPAVGLPAVNVGRRQEGRERGRNVVDAVPDREAIRAAIAQAVSPGFRQSIAGVASPYGDGRAGARIVKVLADLPARETLLAKRFVETASGSTDEAPADPVRAIGGELALEADLAWGATPLFATGRDALSAVATGGVWLVPEFASPVVARTLRAMGCTVQPYPWATPWAVDEAALRPLLVHADGIVVPHYLGLPPRASVWAALEGHRLRVVEDQCLCVRVPPSPHEIQGDYAIGSYRRWLAVPDGAWCVARVAPSPLPTAPPRLDLVRLRLAAALVARVRDDGSLGAEDAALAAASAPLLAMAEAEPARGPLGARASSVAPLLVAAADPERIRAARVANQTLLAELVKGRTSVVLAGPEPARLDWLEHPMLALPVWCTDRERTIRRLAEQGITSHVHWRGGDWSGTGSRAAEWSEHLLSLPVDQRHGADGMRRIADALD